MLLEEHSGEPRQVKACLPGLVLRIEHNQFHREVPESLVCYLLPVVLVLEANHSVFAFLGYLSFSSEE